MKYARMVRTGEICDMKTAVGMMSDRDKGGRDLRA